jgi:hypothetical protein
MSSVRYCGHGKRSTPGWKRDTGMKTSLLALALVGCAVMARPADAYKSRAKAAQRFRPTGQRHSWPEPKNLGDAGKAYESKMHIVTRRDDGDGNVWLRENAGACS